MFKIELRPFLLLLCAGALVVVLAHAIYSTTSATPMQTESADYFTAQPAIPTTQQQGDVALLIGRCVVATIVVSAGADGTIQLQNNDQFAVANLPESLYANDTIEICGEGFDQANGTISWQSITRLDTSTQISTNSQ